MLERERNVNVELKKHTKIAEYETLTEDKIVMEQRVRRNTG